MANLERKVALLALTMVVLWPIVVLRAQNSNATITGTVTDQSGALIPGATVALTYVSTGTVLKVSTGPDGFYSFPNLLVGKYEMQCSAKGFETYVQKGIVLNLNATVQVPIQLHLGASTQTVEVNANASPLNFQTAVVKQGIAKQQIEQLPLMVAGGQRSAAQFITIMPGVNGGSTASAAYSSFNGNEQDADEAVLDGVSMVEGLLSQSGTVAIAADFPISPEAVGEISVLTSNFALQYGATNSAVIVASTKAGTDQFHGGGYEYNRDTAYNARQFGVAERPKDIENDAGGYIGGPFKAPLFWSGRKKTYFFVNFEAYRSRGATEKPILTVPTALMRQGNFSEWPLPIFDPNTTTPNPNFNASQPVGSANEPYLRQQFMGCGGTTPNVICPTDPRLSSSLAPGWLKYVPMPNRPGLISNYESPFALASALNAETDQWDVRGDQFIGDKDHVSVTWHYRGTLPFTQFAFPAVIDTNNTRIPNYSQVVRLNYDHTFSGTVLNHFAAGYLDLLTGLYNASDCCVNQVPHIPGVYDYKHESSLNFSEYSGYGGNGDFVTTRPTWIFNDMVSWVRGSHTIEFGGEYRRIAYPTQTLQNGSGTFNFNDLNTGLLGLPSGNSMASFLLGGVASANATFYSLSAWRPQAQSIGFFAGDTWKATPKLSLDYGLRWDLYTPSSEAKNQTSFFDPNAPNPGAGNRLGTLAFAGTKYGSASFGKAYPEKLFYGGFGPRVGFAYALTNNTVIRAGYGIFFMQDFYPGWNGGIATDGFNATPAFSSSLGGLQPAFLLQNGLPQDFQHPPTISSTFLNGQYAPNYRPFDANQLPRSQQWNLSVDHQFTQNFHTSVAYVGNHGSRLLSQIAPLNAINPSLLSMGAKLFDQFQPGQASLDGVPAPYPGWAAQMTACPPYVAQALQPYPQYCGGIYGQNENQGWSSYNALQLSAEQRFSNGLWLLADYTWSKTLTTSNFVQSITQVSPISPYQRNRNYALANYDIPQIFNLSLVYDLPAGKGERFLNHGGVLNRIVGGWQVSTIFRLQSGVPFGFTSSYCNVPSQFDAGCIPAFLPGANPFAQNRSNFNPSAPLFNVGALQPASTFNFNFGTGAPVSNIHGFGYHNQDIAMTKSLQPTERLKMEFRGEFFNAWNWHTFSGNPFVTDVASPTFGMWNGGVTAPRNIQLGLRFIF
ncbi:MAG TPA: carboxypeptidase regulatory-like domain-containing protein [Terriglobia bacterium]|nr:carboxypeptidase regulatory-like domain-containing protein [Terriglobia bacterium]